MVSEKNIKGFYNYLELEEETETPLTYAYINEDGDCCVAVYGDEEESCVMSLSILTEIFLKQAEGVTIEQYAESVKDQLMKFYWFTAEEGGERDAFAPDRS